MGRGDATRRRILEAAERLVGERGVAALSLREAGALAGARNNSAAIYHFGSKAALVDAIFHVRMTEVNARREALLDRTGVGDPVPGDPVLTSDDPVRRLAAAFVIPLAESLDPVPGSTWYGRFLAAFLADPVASGRLTELDRPELSGMRRWMVEVSALLDHLPAPVRDQRIELAVRLTVMAVADYERARDAGTPGVGSPAWLASGLVDAVAGLLCATASDSTLTFADSLEVLT